MKIKRKRQLNKGIVLALTLCVLFLTPMVVHAAAKYYFYNHPPDRWISWQEYLDGKMNYFRWDGIDSKNVTWRDRYTTNNKASWSNWSKWITGSGTPPKGHQAGADNYYYRQIEVKGVATYTSRLAKIDAKPPTVSYSTHSSSWRNSNLTVTMTPSDTASGVSTWKYRVYQNGAWGGWSSNISGASARSVTISAAGTNRIHAQVVDKCGNSADVYSGYYYIDKTAPSGAFSPNSASWRNSNLSVSFNPSDSGGSGVYRWRYRTSTNNGSSYGGWSSYINGDTTSSITLSSQGSNRIQVQVYDNAGNSNTLTSGTYYIDKTAPTGTISPSSRGWGNSNISISYTPSDSGGSGFYRWRYRIETNGTWGSWTGWNWSGASSFTLSSNGRYRVQVQGKDNAGNTNTVTSGYYHIDKTAPTYTSSSVSGAAYVSGNNYWVAANGKVNVKIRGSDALSGLKYTYLRAYGGGDDARSRHDWNSTDTKNIYNFGTATKISMDSVSRTYLSGSTKEAQWVVSAKNTDADFDLHYYFTDNAGNTLGYVDTGMNLRVDATAPTGSFSLNSRSWSPNNVTTIFTPSDARSGVYRWYYTVRKSDGTAYEQSYVNGSSSKTFTISHEGIYHIETETIDNVGNRRYIESGKFYIDKTAPTGTILKEYNGQILNVHANNVTDNLSGVQRIWIELTDTSDASKSLTKDLSIQSGNNYTTAIDINNLFPTSKTLRIRVKAIDIAGNMREIGTDVFDTFTVKANIQRVLPPHDPVFARGERGIMVIDTVGFVQELEMKFPVALVEEGEIATKKITLTPKAKDTTTYEFFIPLYGPDGDYTINITARKNGMTQETQDNLTVSGTVLDQIKTRLK